MDYYPTNAPLLWRRQNNMNCGDMPTYNRGINPYYPMKDPNISNDSIDNAIVNRLRRLYYMPRDDSMNETIRRPCPPLTRKPPPIPQGTWRTNMTTSSEDSMERTYYRQMREFVARDSWDSMTPSAQNSCMETSFSPCFTSTPTDLLHHEETKPAPRRSNAGASKETNDARLKPPGRKVEITTIPPWSHHGPLISNDVRCTDTRRAAAKESNDSKPPGRKMENTTIPEVHHGPLMSNDARRTDMRRPAAKESSQKRKTLFPTIHENMSVEQAKYVKACMAEHYNYCHKIIRRYAPTYVTKKRPPAPKRR